MSNLAIENAVVDHRIRALRFLPGKPGDLPSINFRGYEDTGIRYDPNTKSMIFSFDGADVYTFDDTGGFSATVVNAAGTEDTITAFATGGQTNATQLSALKSYHRITVCATAGDSVKLPASAVGQHHFVRNDGAASAQLFGLGADTINGIAAATGITLPSGMGFNLYCITAGQWVTGLAETISMASYQLLGLAAQSGLSTRTSPDRVQIRVGGNEIASFLTSGGDRMDLGSDGALSWSNSTTPGGGADITLVRDAANTLAQKVGNVDQITRRYGMNLGYWERGAISELLTLSTGGTTTDTAANLLPANAIIEAVTARVVVTVATATSWQLGDATTAGRFTAAQSGGQLTAGATVVGLVHIDVAGAGGPRQTAAAKLRVTTVGTPSAGQLRITTYYRSFVPATS
jgi:hypothetical protein